MTASSLLSTDEQARVRQALRDALPTGPETTIDEAKVFSRGDERVVPVIPIQYPEDKWAFMSGLAGAEIALRDAGLRVRLESHYAQRMLVVTGAKGHPPFAYLTTDGSEYRDRARILAIDENDPAWVGFEGYLYDTQADFEQVLDEAKKEHPGVDFSRVAVERSSSSRV